MFTRGDSKLRVVIINLSDFSFFSLPIDLKETQLTHLLTLSLAAKSHKTPRNVVDFHTSQQDWVNIDALTCVGLLKEPRAPSLASSSKLGSFQHHTHHDGPKKR